MKFRIGLLLLGAAACQQGSAPSTSSAEAAPAAESKSSDDLRIPADQVVATWKGGKLTYGELVEEASSELKKARTEYLKAVNQIETQVLDRVVMTKVIEAEAKAKGQDQETYLRALAPDDVEVSDEEIQKFYDERVRGQQPMDQVRPRIVAFLKGQAQQKAVAEGIEALKKEKEVEFDLPAPPIPREEFALTGRPSKGPDDAKVTMVEFSDFQCPYCSRATGPVEELLKEFEGKLQVVFLHFPLSFHEEAMPSAIAAECAHKQGKFWEMHDKLFENQRALAADKYATWAGEIGLDADKFTKCFEDPATKARVEMDMQMGTKAGVGGTPSFYINGVQQQGIPNADAIRAALES